jgi:hypothetical protein
MASPLMMTYVFGVEPWPRTLEKSDVEKHKSFLSEQALAARDSQSHLAARTLARGALYWERWLLEKDPGQKERERVISGLELARNAGDWKEAELLLAHCEASQRLALDPFVNTWRDIVRDHLPEQVENEQRLEIAFQRFRNAKTLENDTARTDLARELVAHAKEIGEVGSPVAVNNLLARICASVGWNEEAEQYYTALVVCRPLWIPYIVQVSEHQAKTDIKRAFHTIEMAKTMLGKDFWLVT